MNGYVKHEPCPKCREEGKDTKGDNLARYRNGSAYCFSCGYKEKPTNWKPPEPVPSKVLPSDLSMILPDKNLNWLKQYLSSEQILLNFKYSPSMDRHVFCYGDYWEARSVNPTHRAKVISSGQKPFFVWGSYHNTDTLVVVEDVVSAIKVGSVCMSLCLFGSHFSGEWMTKVAKNPRVKRVVIWLDNDKMKEGRAFADKMRLLGLNVVATCTENDPKSYSVAEIRRIIFT
jgi:hypothetical protein